MRFSALHLLLLGTALAAPVRDIDQSNKQHAGSDSNSLAARGLLPVLPRVVVVPKPVVPKPVVPKPVAPKPVVPGPEPAVPAPEPVVPADPAAPKPVEPSNPDTPTEPGLRPQDPTVPKPNEPETPELPGLIPADPAAPKPADPAAPKPEDPAAPKPDDPAAPKPEDPPAPKPEDPEANPQPKPDEDGPNSPHPDDPDALPPSACSLTKLRKRTQCVPPVVTLTVDKNSLWAKNNIEPWRQEGFQAAAEMDQKVAAGVDSGFKGKDTTTPLDQKQGNVLDEDNYYKTSIEDDPMDVPDADYLRNGPFKDNFQGEQPIEWTESYVSNNDKQLKEFYAWRDQYKQELYAANPDKKKEIDAFFDKNDLEADFIETTLNTHENPTRGTMKVSISSGGKNDLYRGTKYNFNGAEKERPPMGGEDPAWWSDQAMASWREACRRAGIPTSNLKLIARDNIVTPESIKVFDAVFEQMGGQAGQTISVRRKTGRLSRKDEKEAASWDAVAATVHGKGPIRMTRDFPSELGGKKVVAFHITQTPPSAPGKSPRYDMVVELG